MPKSKSKRRYQPPPKKKPKPSPRWFGVVILGMIGAGVITIVGFYGLIPFPLTGTPGSNQALLFGGLGLIGVGFAAATQWR